MDFKPRNWVGFHSWLTMIPELNVGVFISLMSEAPPTSIKQRFLSAFIPTLADKSSPAMLSAYSMNNQFMQHFLGNKRDVGPAVNVDLTKYVGSYLGDRRNFTTAEKLGELVYFGQGIREITANKEGLFLSGSGPWLAQGSGVFTHKTTGSSIQMARDEFTNLMTMTPDIGIYTYSRQPTYLLPNLHTKTLIMSIFLAIFLLFLTIKNTQEKLSTRLVKIFPNVILIIIPFAVFLGYSSGQSMMNDLYAGDLLRTKFVVILCNLLLLSALILLITTFRNKDFHNKKTYLTLANALLASSIFWFYNGIG